MAASGGAMVMWLNLRGFGRCSTCETVTPHDRRRDVVTAAAVVFLLIALAHLGRRGGRVERPSC